jgi:hypothetical protein
MSGWEKADSTARIISSVLMPAAIAYIGYKYEIANTQRSIEAKFVELGVSILQTPPSRAGEHLRRWATEVLNKYSGVAISEGAQDDLINNVPLPPTTGSAVQLPFQLHCTCYAGKTFCFSKESDCMNSIPGRTCTIRYIDNGVFDISDGNKWSSYKQGWTATTCVL